MAKSMTFEDFMYELPFASLHPGGVRKSEKMALDCRLNPTSNILDVGCGKGETLLYLGAVQEGCKGVGIDISQRMIDTAQTKAAKRNLEDNFQFHVGDAYNLPSPNCPQSSFDIVLSECTCGFLDLERAYAGFLKVLKKGGYIGTLDLIWRKNPPPSLANWFKTNLNGYKPRSLQEWIKIYDSFDLTEIHAVDFSEDSSSSQSSLENTLGTAFSLVKSTIRIPSITKKIADCLKILINNKEYIGHAYITGRKS